MSNLNRVIKVTVGNVKVLGLNVDFDISNSTSTSNRTVNTISIHNLSKNVSSKITKGQLIKVDAGYLTGEAVSNVFTGTIERLEVKQGRADTKTVLVCKRGEQINLNQQKSLNFKTDTPYSDIIKEIVGDIPIRFLKDTNLKITKPYAITLTVNDALNLFVTQELGFTWYINANGVINISDKDFEEVGNSSNLKNQFYGVEQVNDDGASNLKQSWRLNVSLAPQVDVGQKIVLDRENIKGTFLVAKLRHVGSNSSQDFKSIFNIEKV